MSDPKVLEKVQRLIALTSSSSEEEARTSAVLACRLIREHGFRVVLATETVADSPRPRAQPRAETPQPDHKSNKYPKPRLIKLTYYGMCLTCGNEVSKGARVWWRPGFGIAHETCDYAPLYEQE